MSREKMSRYCYKQGQRFIAVSQKRSGDALAIIRLPFGAVMYLSYRHPDGTFLGTFFSPALTKHQLSINCNVRCINCFPTMQRNTRRIRQTPNHSSSDTCQEPLRDD